MKFNPYGLHSVRVPLRLLACDPSSGAKLFYGRLALFLGKPKAESFCRPNLETMALKWVCL